MQPPQGYRPGYACVREAGHDGKHVACAGFSHLVAEWADSDELSKGQNGIKSETMHCLKCGGPYTVCGDINGVYCVRCDDPEGGIPRCCFCGAKEHVGKDCPRRSEGEPVLRKMLDQLIPD